MNTKILEKILNKFLNLKKHIQDEGLLEYSITAKTEDLNGVDNIVNKFVQMREKAGSHYNYSWNVKIQIDDISQKIISFEDTEESITRRVKCNYVISRVDSDNTSMLTKSRNRKVL